MTGPGVAEAAARLREAAEAGTPCAPIRDLIAGGGVNAAYSVQNVNTNARLAARQRLVGRKIGVTSTAVQKQLGVDQPDYGMLFADMDVPEGQPIPFDRVMQPKVEAEIALVIGRDLDFEDLTTAEFVRAVEFALPAIEVVGSRIAGWDIGLLDTIADNASSGCFVLGAVPRRLESLDLKGCGMVIERRGEPVSTGAGVACLGSPVSAGLWLARTMARVGRPLMEGDTILTGALGPMVEIVGGDVVEARINGLGSVEAVFERRPADAMED